MATNFMLFFIYFLSQRRVSEVTLNGPHLKRSVFVVVDIRAGCDFLLQS
jgi:hypothetical protein